MGLASADEVRCLRLRCLRLRSGSLDPGLLGGVDRWLSGVEASIQLATITNDPYISAMKKSLFVFPFLFFLLPFLQAQTEAEYTAIINQYFGGQREKVVTGGRIDILTDQYAIEVERASKWKNAIGQALWYAMQENRKAGIVLILEDPGEFNYLRMLQSTVDYAELGGKITVWAYPNDFAGQRSITPSPLDRAAPKADPTAGKTHWLTTSTNTRHNARCHHFRQSAGRYCSEGEGVACEVCGG